MSWQLQDAKQQFSRLVEAARNDGPQVVTRHGREVAVVLSIDEYRRLRGAIGADPMVQGPRSDLFAGILEEITAERTSDRGAG